MSPTAARKSVKKRDIALGLLLGLFAALAVLAADALLHRPTPFIAGPLLAETNGELRDIVIHYLADAQESAGPVYRAFLPQLSAQVTVYVVVPETAVFEEFRRYLGQVRCRLVQVDAGHLITAWSRDRWLAFEPAVAQGPAVLLAPDDEKLTEAWPARAGDRKVADDLAKQLDNVSASRSALLFEGGDFAADSDSVFVTPGVVLRNVQHTVESSEVLERTLQRLFQRKVVMLREAPPHHAGMFMMLAGNKTALVGDPALAKKLLDESGAEEGLGDIVSGGPDFSAEAQRLYDAVAEQCREAGYQVLRVPTLHSREGKGYATYVNALIDNPGGKRVVYLPVYDRLERLNQAAAAVWQELGYEVRPVNVSSVYRLGGTLHCLVNVLRR